nr:MAG TPA: hypothetical protein [Caudoviricetes sp.]
MTVPNEGAPSAYKSHRVRHTVSAQAARRYLTTTNTQGSTRAPPPQAECKRSTAARW